MNKLFIGISGILVIAFVGYLTLSAYLGRRELMLREKVILSPIFFFNSVVVVYVFNLFFEGSIMSRTSGFLFVTGGYLLLHILFGYSNVQRDVLLLKCRMREKSLSMQWIKLFPLISLLLISVVIAIMPMMLGMKLSGDAGRHVLFAEQLLNGFPLSHYPPYKETGSLYYPFLTHATMAYFVRLLSIHIFDSYLILQLFQALLLPIAMFVLIYKLTERYAVSLMAVIFITLYGGHNIAWDDAHSWWFNTAIERVLPDHITRMLSLVFLPIFLYAFVKVLEDKKSGFFLISSGLVVGLAGLCHTYAFAFMLLFIVICLISGVGGKRARKNCILILLIGFSVAVVAYVPTIIESIWVRKTALLDEPSLCGGGAAKIPKGQALLTPWSFLSHYGAVGIMAVFSLIFVKKAKYSGFYLALFFTVVAILLMTYLKEAVTVIFDVTIPYHPTQQKFGKSIFTVCVILSSMFFKWLLESIEKGRRGHRLVVQWLAIFGLMGVSAAGFYSTARFANKWWKLWYAARSSERFRQSNNIVNVIKEHASVSDVVAVPESVMKCFPYLAGVDVLYSEGMRTYSHCRRLANAIVYAPKQVRKELEEKNDVKYMEILKNVLIAYHVTLIVVPEERALSYSLDFLKPVDSGTWKDGKKYLAYSVNEEVIRNTRLGLNRKLFIDSILASDDNYNILLKYYPLYKRRHLKPRIFGARELKITGLTWGDGALWMADLEGKKIYQIDPETGNVLLSIGNPVDLPGGLAWDGESLWSADGKRRMIHKLDPYSGYIVKSVSTPAYESSGLAWGDKHLWNADSRRGKIYKIDPVGGKMILSLDSPGRAIGVAWHRDSLWLSLMDGKVQKLEIERDRATTCFANPGYRITRLAWADKNVWISDGLSSNLIEFIAPHSM